MKTYDIFISEGGYRVCGATWNDGPIMENSPWFETEEEAKAAAQEMRFKDAAHGCDIGKIDGQIMAIIPDEFIICKDLVEAQEIILDYLEKLGFNQEYSKKHLKCLQF